MGMFLQIQPDISNPLYQSYIMVNSQFAPIKAFVDLFFLPYLSAYCGEISRGLLWARLT